MQVIVPINKKFQPIMFGAARAVWLVSEIPRNHVQFFVRYGVDLQSDFFRAKRNQIGFPKLAVDKMTEYRDNMEMLTSILNPDNRAPLTLIIEPHRHLVQTRIGYLEKRMEQHALEWKNYDIFSLVGPAVGTPEGFGTSIFRKGYLSDCADAIVYTPTGALNVHNALLTAPHLSIHETLKTLDDERIATIRHTTARMIDPEGEPWDARPQELGSDETD